MLAQKIDTDSASTQRVERIIGETRFVSSCFLNPVRPFPVTNMTPSFKKLLVIANVSKFGTIDVVIDISDRAYGARRAAELYPRLCLGHLYGLLVHMAQQKSTPSFLRTDGGSTYCFMDDRNNAPWLVRIYRDSKGWGFGADEAERDIGLAAESHFLKSI